MPSTISIDSAYAPEIVEFWVHKYQQIKEELEQAKVLDNHSTSQKEQEIQKQSKALQDLIQTLQQEYEQRKSTDSEFRNLLAQIRVQDAAKTDALAAAEMAEKLLRVQTANEDLSRQLAASESEKILLIQQMQHFYSQATTLAREADVLRREKVQSMFEPVDFVGESFESRPLTFAHPQSVLSVLPADTYEVNRLYFLPRPPTCMPLRVPSCGKHGYWFYPAWVLPEEAEFELIVEGRPSEWLYLGRYVSVVFPGGEMKLSEWMSLDEETKMGHCMRIALQNPSQAVHLPQNITHPLEVKRRYETGVWSVPCFTLQCVGFNKLLYESLQAAAAAIEKSVSPNGVSGKRKSESQEDYDIRNYMNLAPKKARGSSHAKK